MARARLLHRPIDRLQGLPAALRQDLSEPEFAMQGIHHRPMRHFTVHVINPKQLERLRDRVSLAGAKDDRRDARVAAGGLRTDPHVSGGAIVYHLPVADPWP